jgi:transposase
VGLLLMSDKERERKAIMEMVKAKKLKLTKAAKQLEVSYRQAKRIYKKYLESGDVGLVHKNRGKPSNNNHPQREQILSRYKERYAGFGPTLAAEKLIEDGFYVDHETLRRWLIQENLWIKQRKRSPHRQRRAPKEQFGEMLQIDGSFHDWFENETQPCLLNFVDDATTTTMSRLEEGETTRGLFRLLWKWIETYGIPLSVYVDLKSVYVGCKSDGFSHFRSALDKLGVKLIKAYSPQAKGRVERNHGVYQDRFVKELRLKEAKTIECANQVLIGGFYDELNRKFAKPAANSKDAHRPCTGELNQILCWEYSRQIQNDWTISFRNQCYQIHKTYGVGIKPKSTVTVRVHLDDSVTVWYKNHPLSIEKLDKRPEKIKEKTTRTNSPSQAGKRGTRNSPWNQFNPCWLTNKKNNPSPQAV